MWKKKLTTEEKVKLFSEEIIKGLSEELESLALYGSVAKDEHIEGVSDINFLIVAKSLSLELLQKVGDIYKKFEKENIALPLVIDTSYVKTSLDVFPIEFLEIKEGYRVIYGKEIFDEIEISDFSLRLELEREIKGKLLALRQGIIRFYGTENFSGYLFKTIKSFKIYIETVLKLAGEKPEKSFSETISIFTEKFNIPLKGIEKLWEKYKKKETVGRDEIEKITIDYLNEIELLADFIDKFEVIKN